MYFCKNFRFLAFGGLTSLWNVLNTFFRKCPSDCDNHFEASVTQTYARISMKFLNELLLDINECLSPFDENHTSGGAAVPEFSGCADLSF